MKKKIKIAFFAIIITAFSFICLNFYYHNNLFGNYYNEIDNKLCFAFNPDNSGIFIDPITNSKYYISWSYSKLLPNSLTFEFSARNFNLPLVAMGKNNLKVPVKWPVNLLNGRGVYNLLYKKNTPWWSYKITDNYLYAGGMGDYNGLKVFVLYRTKKSLWLDIVSVNNLRNAVSTWGFIILIGFGITIMLVIVRDYFNFTMNSRPIQHSVMNRKKLTSTETSKKSATIIAESTSIGIKEIDKLTASLNLFFTILDEKKKLDLLEIFLQLQHNNSYFDKFYEIFPDFIYNPDTNREQFKNIINNPCPLDDLLLDDEETMLMQEQKLIKFLKSIKSPSEIFRFYSVFYCVQGNKEGQEKFLHLSYDSRKAEKKSPHYSTLIHLTEIQMLIHNKNYVKVGELLKHCNQTFLKDNSFGEESRLLKLRFAELM